MHEEDGDAETGFVVKFKQNFDGLKDAKKCQIDDIDKTIKKCKGDANMQKGQFETVMKQVPDMENHEFGKDIKKFLDSTDGTIAEIEQLFTKMTTIFQEVNDIYMIGKNDDARKKAEKFIEFWMGFIDSVQNSMPKVEKKKAASKKKPAKAAGGGMDNDLLAELKAKQAAMKNK